jgi:hypothetical protein
MLVKVAPVAVVKAVDMLDLGQRIMVLRELLTLAAVAAVVVEELVVLEMVLMVQMELY